jgi:hypothetical protein
MSSQTGFLIILHVDRTGPQIVLIYTHVTTFFGDSLRKKFFQKSRKVKAAVVKIIGLKYRGCGDQATWIQRWLNCIVCN